MSKYQSTRLLGYPQDARLLIINADDFGMCNAINEAIFRVLAEGVVHSTSLMVPCPWASQAINFLNDHSEIPFGVHLTVVCDSDNYTWGPVTSWEKVSELVDRSGKFYRPEAFPKVLDQNLLNQLELEFRAQIEFVLAAGLKPSHLDWHYLRLQGRNDIFDLMLRLAREYGLALRVYGRSFIQKVHSLGLPSNDHDFLDSYFIDPGAKPSRYSQLLRELPAGLSEWAVHPGLDNSELLALEPDGNHFRQTDFEFWTSQQAKDLIEEQGVILLDYRSIQEFWIRK